MESGQFYLSGSVNRASAQKQLLWAIPTADSDLLESEICNHPVIELWEGSSDIESESLASRSCENQRQEVLLQANAFRWRKVFEVNPHAIHPDCSDH